MKFWMLSFFYLIVLSICKTDQSVGKTIQDNGKFIFLGNVNYGIPFSQNLKWIHMSKIALIYWMYYSWMRNINTQIFLFVTVYWFLCVCNARTSITSVSLFFCLYEIVFFFLFFLCTLLLCQLIFNPFTPCIYSQTRRQ
jgi:hypothetical protein